jgi:hypothetical protein
LPFRPRTIRRVRSASVVPLRWPRVGCGEMASSVGATMNEALNVRGARVVTRPATACKRQRLATAWATAADAARWAAMARRW